MMKPLLIQGGHIIDPSQGIDEIGSLLITEGKISWLGKSEETPPQPSNEGIIATIFQGELAYKDDSVKLKAKGKL